MSAALIAWCAVFGYVFFSVIPIMIYAALIVPAERARIDWVHNAHLGHIGLGGPQYHALGLVCVCLLLGLTWPVSWIPVLLWFRILRTTGPSAINAKATEDAALKGAEEGARQAAYDKAMRELDELEAS